MVKVVLGCLERSRVPFRESYGVFIPEEMLALALALVHTPHIHLGLDWP